MMEADYTYYDNNRVFTIIYGSGADVAYQYDNAGRLTQIDHWNPGNTILRLDYTYTNRDEIATITELDAMSAQTITTFTYDARGRLTSETRAPGIPPPLNPVVYDLTYVYDDAGNRLQKIDAVNDRRVDYTYDIADPVLYESANNRLRFYETFDTSGGGNVSLSKTWYYYNDNGIVTRIVTGPPHPQLYDPMSATRFDYAQNQQAVAFIVGEEWLYSGPTIVGSSQITFAREFRYDGARQRYLVRKLDPVAMMAWQYDPLDPDPDTWSDYDGADIYGDFTVSGSTTTPVRSFEPGMGKFGWMDDGFGTQVPDDTTVAYCHTNHIGTTRLMTDSAGTAASAVAYTAFGELVSGTPDNRYGYAKEVRITEPPNNDFIMDTQ